MKTNPAGIELIKSFEKCVLTTYVCPAGKLTIGWGHTGPDVIAGKTITQAQADKILACDLADFESAMNACIKAPVTENQFSAIVSLAYNCGAQAIANSTLIKKLNAGDVSGAANEFLRWDKIKGVASAGLARRRWAEKELFSIVAQT